MDDLHYVVTQQSEHFAIVNVTVRYPGYIRIEHLEFLLSKGLKVTQVKPDTYSRPYEATDMHICLCEVVK